MTAVLLPLRQEMAVMTRGTTHPRSRDGQSDVSYQNNPHAHIMLMYS